MAKYEVQIMYMEYKTIEAENEREAISEAKEKLRNYINNLNIEVSDFSFNITDHINET